jgi:RNA polymerase sigma factor (sigma-70 family)
MSDTTPLSLLERLRVSADGDEWEVFVTIYTPYIEGYLRHLGVSEEDVADVRQEVLRVVVKEIPRFEHNRQEGAFRSWLRIVIANRLRSFNRAQANQPESGGSSYLELAERMEDSADDVCQMWEEEHNRYVVQGLLRVVSVQHKPNTILAFQRVFLEDQAAERVAEDLAMTKNAVRIAQARVLRSLRELGEGLID